MRNWTVLAALALAAASQADIWYTVKAQPGAKGLEITLAFDAPKGDSTLQIPRWSPGAYGIGDYASRVTDVKAVGDNNLPLPVGRVNHETWKTTVSRPQRIKLTYTLDGAIGDRVHYGGPSTYLYLVGRKEEACHLKVECPANWGIYVGLNPDTGRNAFYAPTYDVLADNPVTLGDLPNDTYMSGGVPHSIVYHSGPVEKLDRKQVVATLHQISDYMVKFWGRLPFDKYVWHVSVMDSPGGGWGLEHLSSTQVGMATGFNPGTKSVMAHEYFHAWNVKRVRSSVLGPFDYQKLPRTGALWWLEGVTDYYASVILSRGGIMTPEYLQSEAARQTEKARGNPLRLTNSIYNASYILNKAETGLSAPIDYYTFGWLAGMCFDLELRDQSDGKVTLDDVEHDLFALCNGKPGFPEDGVRSALIKRGGEKFGRLYDTWILKPGELPIEEQLAKVGLQLVKTETTVPRMPFGTITNGPTSPVTVDEIIGDGGGLKKGDILVMVGGKPVEQGFRGSRTVSQVATAAKVGDLVVVTVKRGNEEITFKVAVAGRPQTAFGVKELPGATERQKRLWAAWCGASK
ncbi:MAG: hypothetical protein JSS65_02365 [Armatimonadetes bacterium]|nr:hypothetical protein [Armatimonadota bacterium]